MNIKRGELRLMEEIVAIFRNQIPEFITEMKHLNENRKYPELGLLAHKAKGSVTVMGMEETSKMLKTFELQAKAGVNPPDYQVFIERFEADTLLVMKEIEDYIGKSR